MQEPTSKIKLGKTSSGVSVKPARSYVIVATRAVRREPLDKDLQYDTKRLDRDIVAPDHICIVARTYRERLFSEILAGANDLSVLTRDCYDHMDQENRLSASRSVAINSNY